MDDVTSEKKIDLPLWLGLGLLTLGLLGAGWMFWTELSDAATTPRGVFAIDGAPPAVPPAGRPSDPPRSPLRPFGPDIWRLQSGNLSLAMRRQENLWTPRLIATTRVPDSQWVVRARGRLFSDTGRKIGLSDTQIEALNALPARGNVPVSLSAAQQKLLQDRFGSFLAAAEAGKQPAEQQLLAALDQIRSEVIPPLQARVEKQYALFRQSLTPAQWDQLRALGSGGRLQPDGQE